MRNQKKQEAVDKRSRPQLNNNGEKSNIRLHNPTNQYPNRNPENGQVNPPISHSPSSKKINPQHRYPKLEERGDNMSKSNSNMSRGRQSDSYLMVDRVVQLHERLKNIHHFYKTRIEEEKARVNQRNQVFMGIVEEIQRSHNQKSAGLRKLVEEAEGEKKDVGLVDERMNEIKGSIDQILKQSADLKARNERLERQINDKAHSLREKEEELGKFKEELMEARNELEGFERLNLRENKRNKQLIVMIDKTTESVANRT